MPPDDRERTSTRLDAHTGAAILGAWVTLQRDAAFESGTCKAAMSPFQQRLRRAGARGSSASARANTASTASGSSTPRFAALGGAADRGWCPSSLLDHRRSRDALRGLRPCTARASNIGPRPSLPEGFGRPLLRRAVCRGERGRRVPVLAHPTGDLAGRALHLADAEIQDLHDFFACHLGNEDVLWLQIAVNDRYDAFGPAEVVQALERACDGVSRRTSLRNGSAARPSRFRCLISASSVTPLEPLEKSTMYGTKPGPS